MSLLARSALAAVAAVPLVAPGVAAADEFSDPVVPVDEFSDPMFPGDPGELDYPADWDPSLEPGLEMSAVGLVFDPASDLVFDPFNREIFDINTGEAWTYDGGVTSLPVPDFILADVRQMFGVDGAAPAEPFNQPAQADPDNAGPGIATDLEGFDPILPNYRLQTPVSELGEFAVDTAALPEGAIDEAFQFAAYEIALLVELNAFDRNQPWYPTFVAIHDEFDLGDFSRSQVLSTFVAVDEQLAARSNLFGQALTADDFYVQWVVQPLNSTFMDQAARGEWSFMAGPEYAAGLLRLLASGGEVESTVTGSTTAALETSLAQAMEALAIQEDLNQLLRLEAAELRSAVAALADSTVDSVAAEIGGGDQGLIAENPIALAAVVLLVLAGLALIVRRRRRGPADAPDAVQYAADETVATAQMLAGAKDETAIVRVLDRAAARQLNAPIALFHVVPEGLRQAGGDMIVVDSDLQLVIETGQRSVRVLDNDPAFPGESRAIIATPVIHGGKVQAVLVAHRPGDETFTDADRRTLEPIAPALGGALERAAELGTMSHLAMVDGLTSLGNRRRLDGDLETTISSAVAGDAPLGFAMIDVDHFKTYNDTHGHTAGDDVLRRVAATIARCVRGDDVVYRYGGEEFSMLLPGATPEDAALVAERVRAAVEAEVFPGEEHQPGGALTVSVGVATLSTGSGDDIRERADRALYEAKNNGRNRVAFA